jgi:isopentenyl-diphosphate delta-isomerase
MNDSAAGKPGAREHVVLVDDRDRELGTAPKMEAHRDGTLHRAVSAFLLDGRGNMLLQRRATTKYHSAGLWSNTCCTHPRPGEQPGDAAHRRLTEEMGIDCPLSEAGNFLYRAKLENGLIEHELDHLFLGFFEGTPAPDANEVAEWRWFPLDELASDLAAAPQRFTAWLGLALHELMRAGYLPLSQAPLQKDMYD